MIPKLMRQCSIVQFRGLLLLSIGGGQKMGVSHFFIGYDEGGVTIFGRF